MGEELTHCGNAMEKLSHVNSRYLMSLETKFFISSSWDNSAIFFWPFLKGADRWWWNKRFPRHSFVINIRSFWMITKSVLSKTSIRISDYWFLHNPKWSLILFFATVREMSVAPSIRTRIASRSMAIFWSLCQTRMICKNQKSLPLVWL